MPPTILVTGFAPFDGESINPSWQATRQLEGWTAGGHVVVTREIPCVFGASLLALEATVSELRPTAVISLGQAGGGADLLIERLAVNLDDSEEPDNVGETRIDRPVIVGASAAYFASLPVKEITAEMRRVGLQVSLLNSVGGFVCNHLFYGLSPQSASVQNDEGRLHPVPYAPDQGERHPDAPTMSIDAMVEGLRYRSADDDQRWPRSTP